ncbi:MAG: SH3 domain-containing protein [Candidatus Omnitrophica bacterium]|nr:SH3 domain-containing protein [Candidatus Omnitrophota bacterium]
MDRVSIFAQEEFSPAYAVVLKDKVNIRAGAGPNFEILGQADKNEELAVAGATYDWYKVKLPEDARCYVHRDYIRDNVAQADKLRLRAGCGLNYNVLGMIKQGERVQVIGQEGDWLRIVPPENCFGWIKKDCLELSRRKYLPQPVKRVSVLPAVIQKNQVRISGIIKDQGQIFGRLGTHKLTVDKKTRYYLQSDQIDLKPYVYHRVSITGEIVNTKKKSRYPLINVQEIKEEE